MPLERGNVELSKWDSDKMRRNFSERNGLTPIPPQFTKGEISKSIRNKVADIFIKTIDTYKKPGSIYLQEGALQFFRKIHVEFFVEPAHEFGRQANDWKSRISIFVLNAPYNNVLDLLEFCCVVAPEHGDFENGISEAFFEARSAYRLTNKQFVQISSEEELVTLKKVHEDIERNNQKGAKLHLNKSAMFLRGGEWADSIRESIHAVESVISSEVGATSLGAGLNKIDKSRPIHPALKSAFSQIYGYTSDEEGIRHALIEGDREPTEEEAMFMFGACASFISYLLNSDKTI